jgi:hypothetical protein
MAGMFQRPLYDKHSWADERLVKAFRSACLSTGFVTYNERQIGLGDGHEGDAGRESDLASYFLQGSQMDGRSGEVIH